VEEEHRVCVVKELRDDTLHPDSLIAATTRRDLETALQPTVDSQLELKVRRIIDAVVSVLGFTTIPTDADLHNAIRTICVGFIAQSLWKMFEAGAYDWLHIIIIIAALVTLVLWKPMTKLATRRVVSKAIKVCGIKLNKS
jgi:hypothetical protein